MSSNLAAPTIFQFRGNTGVTVQFGLPIRRPSVAPCLTGPECLTVARRSCRRRFARGHRAVPAEHCQRGVGRVAGEPDRRSTTSSNRGPQPQFLGVLLDCCLATRGRQGSHSGRMIIHVQPTETPRSRPMAAVTAIARAPPTVTRTAARPSGAPPRYPPNAPRAARLISDRAAIAGMRQPRARRASPESDHGESTQSSRPKSTRLASDARGMPVDAELIPQVCAEPVAGAELLRDFHRELLLEASLDVNHGQLVQLGLRLTRKLALLALDVGLLRVALRADGHVLAHGHRHRPSDQARHAGDQDGPFRCGRRGDANHEARPTRWRHPSRAPPRAATQRDHSDVARPSA